MKKIAKIFHRCTAPALMWILPLLLVLPGAVLAYTEYLYTGYDRFVNIALPLGFYLLCAGAWRRIGLTSILFFPLMVLCAFQLVLIYLYGESIIAIDMFLNVLTTNSREVGELLGNLLPAVAAVCVLYLPPLGAGIWLTVKKDYTTRVQRRPALIVGGILLFAGLCGMGMAYASDPDGYHPSHRLFPVNVISNIGSACKRSMQTRHYAQTSASFTFHAADSRGASGDGEIYVMVIGETARAENWELAGYCRPTNPRLSHRRGVVFYPYVMSESNTTHKSVPLMMSHLTAAEFGDSINDVKGVIGAFEEAGYATAWFSAQRRNGALIDAFGEEADTAVFITDDGADHHDMELCRLVEGFLALHAGEKIFITLHTYGSHFNYRERYTDDYRIFSDDNAPEAAPEYRRQLLDSYDNTIVYTDAVLDSLASMLTATGRPAAMIYAADHGEDIFDDYRTRFLHASPTPTTRQLHVPMVVWTSEGYAARHPATEAALRANRGRQISSSRSMFNTIVDLAGVNTPNLDRRASLASAEYTEPRRMYLNDYNEAVPLELSGLRSVDFAVMDSLGIRP